MLLAKYPPDKHPVRPDIIGVEGMTAFLRYQELQQYVGWTDEDAERVRLIGPALVPAFEALIDDFYAEIELHPEARKVITGGPEQTARLKRTLHGWLHELFSGSYDRNYVERRWRVGYRHVDIGLNQVYTNAALSRLRRGLLKTLEEVWSGSTDDLLSCRVSLNTLLDLDLAIIEDAYQTEYQRRQASAERLAMQLAQSLDLVGLVALEMFVTKDGRFLANEIAPRPHNSGHWTIDACTTSQFEQLVRAICGLPLGAVDRLANAEMKNLIGEDFNLWRKAIGESNAKVHLYGKTEIRPGRKMGHVTRLQPLNGRSN